MSWRGTEGGIAAAKQKHDVIMTPGGPVGLYFDHAQSDSKDEPTNIGGHAPYSLVYNYDPVPTQLSVDEQKYIVGVQANLWAEYLPTPKKVEYFLLPRMLGLSETAWSQTSRKDLKNFSEERLPIHLSNLDKTDTNYWVPTPLGQDQKVMNGEQFEISLKEPMPASKIYYTFDGTRPSELAALYTKPIKTTVSKGKKLVLKTIVVTPSGKQSVVKETILNNGAADVKTK
jgi:hexosaminidase